MRSTPGSSFGPMATRATTPIRTSSLHPMSNMRSSVHAKPRPAQSPTRRIRAAIRVSRAPGSDGFAADVGPRRGRRGIVLDRLGRLGGLVGDLVVVLHALLERL